MHDVIDNVCVAALETGLAHRRGGCEILLDSLLPWYPAELTVMVILFKFLHCSLVITMSMVGR